LYPKEYIQYLVYFHSLRDYFECHEVLEEYWKSEPKDKRKQHWVGLIQIAVGLYHHRRDNNAGALKMLNSSKKILSSHEEELRKLGLDVMKLLKLVEVRIDDIKRGKKYSSLNLPIVDQPLIDQCLLLTNEWGGTWGTISDLTDEFLVNKHKDRNRQGVIAERLEQLEKKKKNRG
jgi:uncharacterized protein